MSKKPATYVNADSHIESVTVYESSAQVHRIAEVKLAEFGDIVCQFRDLPEDLNRDSLQVALHCADAAVVINLSGITFDTLREPRAEATKDRQARDEAKARAQALDIERQAVEDEIERVKSQIEFRSRCFDRATGEFSEKDTDDACGGDVAMWAKMMDSSLENRDAATRRLRTLQDKLADVKAEIATLSSFSTSSYECNVKYNVVRVHLHVARPGEAAAVPSTTSSAASAEKIPKIDLQLSYVVKGTAEWEAAYDLRVDSAKQDTLELAYNAVISQSSTEVWDNVRIQLSTARAAVQGNPPELSPWRATLVPKAGRGGGRGGRSSGAADVDDDEESVGGSHGGGGATGEMSAMTVASSTIEEGATSVSFTLPGEHTVGNNKHPLRVTLATVPLKAEFSYLTRPSELDAAFAQVKATNMSSFTMVAGSLTVFVDHQYISKSRLGRVAPRGTFKASLGVDSSITIKYKTIAAVKSEEGGMLTSKKKKTLYKNVTTVKNCKPLPITLIIEQSVPISNDSSITVDIVEPRYDATNNTEALKRTDEGILVQQVRLASMQEAVVPLQYSVLHLATDTITGI